jgi:hypothetical protein
MFNVRINLCVDFHLPKLQLRNIAIKWLCDSSIGNWCRYAYSYVEYTRRADVQLVNIVILSCIWLSERFVINLSVENIAHDNGLSISISATQIHLNLMVSHLKHNVWIHKTNINSKLF